jgi:hypothetical protein
MYSTLYKLLSQGQRWFFKSELRCVECDRKDKLFGSTIFFFFIKWTGSQDWLKIFFCDFTAYQAQPITYWILTESLKTMKPVLCSSSDGAHERKIKYPADILSRKKIRLIEGNAKCCH